MKSISLSKLKDLIEITDFEDNPPVNVLEDWYVTEEDDKTKHKYSDEIVNSLRQIRLAKTKLNIIFKNI